MLQVVRWALLLLAGCGRLAFEPLASDAPAEALPQVVQIQTAMVTGASAQVVLDPTRAHDMIVIGTLNVEVPGVAAQLTGIHDDAGNTYQSTGQIAMWEPPNGLVQIWFAPDVFAGTATITIDSDASTFRSIWAIEIANVAVLDTVKCESDVMQPALPVGATVTPVHMPVAIISTTLIDGTLTTIEPGNPFTAAPPINGDGTAFAIATTPGSYAPVWNFSPTGNNVTGSCTAAFSAP